MSKAILEFDLSDLDDLASYTRVVNADKMAAALFEIRYNMMKKVQNTIEATGNDALDCVGEELTSIFEDCHLNIDEITQ